MTPRGGQYLTFCLGVESYGVPIGRVRSILGLPPVTPVPAVPAYVRGVINLRGQVLPVIDLRVRLGMTAIEPTGQTCVIVVEGGGPTAALRGLIVDRVCEVPHVTDDAVADPPALGEGVDTRVMLGLAKIAGTVTVLLDLDHVLGPAAAVAA